jgi:phage repressor protein C with HTH and peptisase S24 domain
MSDPRKAQGNRLKAARKAAGYRSAAEAAEANGWKDGTYRTHEAGTRTIGPDDAEKYAKRFRSRGVDISAPQILFDEAGAAREVNHDRQLSIMGRVGAGATIDTEFEQAPPDGFEQIELPYEISKEMIGFRVIGDSMSPAYEPDAIIVVEREPTHSIESLIGNSAIVIIAGRRGERLRYLKRIQRGQNRGRFDLESINDRTPTIHDIGIVWAAPVRMIIPNIGIRWLRRIEETAGTKRARTKK